MAPTTGMFSHGAWKNGKFWIVLDNDNLYSYDPAANTWSASLNTFGGWANVATSGPASNLIYVNVTGGTFYSYDVTTGTTTTLTSHPFGFVLGGNGQFTWFGATVGFIYAADGTNGYAPAIYDIANSTWHALSDPRSSKITRDTRPTTLPARGSTSLAPKRVPPPRARSGTISSSYELRRPSHGVTLRVLLKAQAYRATHKAALSL